MTRYRLTALAAVTSLALAGCSFFVPGLSRSWRPSHGEPECGTSMAAPGVDGVVAVAATALSLSIAAERCENDFLGICSSMRAGMLGLGIVVVSGYTIAAIHGASKVGRCRRAHNERRAYLARPAHVGPPGAAPPSSLDPPPGSFDPGASGQDDTARPATGPESAICRNWRRRLAAAPPDQRGHIVQQMPKHCHE